MHPQIGWSEPFSIITKIMLISVPIIIVMQIASIIVVFFSVGNDTRLNAFLGLLKFGASYNLFLVTFPFWTIFLACAIPGPKPEKFGVGNLRIKTSLVMLAAALLTTGAIIRTYAFFNPRPAQNDDVLYGKPVFYVTQFLMELAVVAVYALLRFDLLFHIPNGSSEAGDYSLGMSSDSEKAESLTRKTIEYRIAASGVPYQILAPSYSKSMLATGADQPVYAVFFPQAAPAAGGTNEESLVGTQDAVYEQPMATTAFPPGGLPPRPPRTAFPPGGLPPRPPRRVSRMESFMEVVQRRQSRGRPVWDDGTVSGIPSSDNWRDTWIPKDSSMI